jgi:hypothetical protein
MLNLDVSFKGDEKYKRLQKDIRTLELYLGILGIPFHDLI